MTTSTATATPTTTSTDFWEMKISYEKKPEITEATRGSGGVWKKRFIDELKGSQNAVNRWSVFSFSVKYFKSYFSSIWSMRLNQFYRHKHIQHSHTRDSIETRHISFSALNGWMASQTNEGAGERKYHEQFKRRYRSISIETTAALAATAAAQINRIE